MAMMNNLYGKLYNTTWALQHTSKLPENKYSLSAPAISLLYKSIIRINTRLISS